MILDIPEQINSDNFFKFCDYIYTPRENYDYVLQVMQKYPHLKMFSPNNPLKQPGIIYSGMCVLIEECFQIMPNEGSYILIQRDNERAFNQEQYKQRKPSVKHIYSIECQVLANDVTALPFGTASIGGDSAALWQVQNEDIPKVRKPVFCRMNTNKNTKARSRAVNDLLHSPLADVVTEQLNSEDFFRQIKAHKFNMSLQSGGKDTTRTWETLFLGTIPIISDCVELRHFEDMPVAYYPVEVTERWLDSVDVSGKSLKRARMSYWRDEILKRRAEF